MKIENGIIRASQIFFFLKKYVKQNMPDIMPDRQYRKPNNDSGRLTIAAGINMP
jgi:hypothetical protein